eukprot:375586-Hanusia_phi.AAC.1
MQSPGLQERHRSVIHPACAILESRLMRHLPAAILQIELSLLLLVALIVILGQSRRGRCVCRAAD